MEGSWLDDCDTGQGLLPRLPSKLGQTGIVGKEEEITYSPRDVLSGLRGRITGIALLSAAPALPFWDTRRDRRPNKALLMR